MGLWLPLLLQHKDAYQVILDGVKGGPKEKRLAAQFIPKFFSSFPELADAAINAQLDLCEDEDVSVSARQHRTGEFVALFIGSSPVKMTISVSFSSVQWIIS